MTDTTRSAPTFVAFASGRLIAAGSLDVVAHAAKVAIDAGAPRVVQVFDAVTSEPCDLDLSGGLADVDRRYCVHAPGTSVATAPPGACASGESTGHAAARPGPGRPKLGVVAREVTLLPRHWAWLNEQSGGASAALRRLVEEARRSNAPREQLRRAQDRTYRFLMATLGDAPGFEEAMRALYACDEHEFLARSRAWPRDLRTHARGLADAAFHPQVS